MVLLPYLCNRSFAGIEGPLADALMQGRWQQAPNKGYGVRQHFSFPPPPSLEERL